jgi:hypothetical protein
MASRGSTASHTGTRGIGHRALVSPGRGLREGDRPAARARQSRQRPLGHLPGELHVDDLRPPRLNGLRAALPPPRRIRTPPGPARPSYHPGPDPVSVIFPGDRAARLSCGPCCAPARTAAAPAWPLSPRSAPSMKASRSPCCPSPAGAPPPPAAAPAAVPAPAPHPAPPPHRDLPVLRLHDRAQPRVGSAQPGRVIRHGLIGYAPQAPTPAGTPH